jgi:8-oxo-dGTP diphosphatase
MDCFLAKVKSGTLTLKEHDAAKWLHRDDFDSIDWLPADEVIIKELKNE